MSKQVSTRLPLPVYLFALMLSIGACGPEKETQHAGEHEHDHDGEAEHDSHEHHHDEKSLGHVSIPEDALAANRVVLARAGEGVVRTEIELPGEVILNADRVAHIVPRFPGIVLKVNKVLGDRVRAGDVLAVIQSNVSAAPYDVTALVDGMVVEKHVTLGEYVRDDADIFVVADLATVWINISVYARFLPQVKTGQKVRITAAGLDETTNGVIDYVGPIVGESTRTGVARVVLPNPKGTWQPGLFVSAHIAVLEARASVAVPDEAIQTIDGTDVVFVREGEHFTARPITIGRRGSDLVEVIAGLEPGEEYAARGSFIFKAEFGKSEAAHEH